MPISKTEQLSVWEAIGEEYEFLTGEALGQEFGARVETFNRECEVVKQSAIPAKSPRAGEAREAERYLASYVCGKTRSPESAVDGLQFPLRIRSQQIT